MSLSMQGERLKEKKRRKRNKFRPILNLSQEKGSYFFFIGLLIIAIFSCVSSGAPKQGFYGILFISIGILVALFPPAFITPKWLIIGLTLFLISLSASLLPRDFVGSQNWRTKLESLGLDTGNLITPHPAATIESLIIVGVIVMLTLCSLGHRISRNSFLKIATLFVLAVSIYAGISMLFVKYHWNWAWNPNDQFGFFANRNHMATLMVIGSLIGVGSLFIYLKKKNWSAFLIVLLATSIICWAILGYSVSRAGLILFISLHVLWFGFVVKDHLNYKLVTSFIVLFSLAVILFFLSDTKLEGRFENLVKKKESDSRILNNDQKNDYVSILGLRRYIHADTYKMIRSEPWTGTGLGTFEFIFPFYQKESVAFSEWVANSKALHPESNWLDLSSQAGLLSVLIALIVILPLLFTTFFKNKRSRSWLLCLSCILSIFCILLHGVVDVPGQKFGIILSGILLIGVTLKLDHSTDKASKRYTIITYQLLAVGIFSLGLILVHSQWFSSSSIVFSDTQTRINKIQKLHQLSIDSARENDEISQKKFLISAIDLTESAIQRSPLDSDLHFICGKLYSFLDGNEDKIKSSFKIESALDPTWFKLPLRQSQVWLFIDIKETRELWREGFDRANRINDKYSKDSWNEILTQARQHPIHLRDVYKIILSKDDPYYIKGWMNYAGKKNLNTQMPNILRNKVLSDNSKNDILSYWKRISPKDFKKYSESRSMN